MQLWELVRNANKRRSETGGTKLLTLAKDKEIPKPRLVYKNKVPRGISNRITGKQKRSRSVTQLRAQKRLKAQSADKKKGFNKYKARRQPGIPPGTWRYVNRDGIVYTEVFKPTIPPGKWRYVNRDGILYTEEFKNVTENSKYSKYKTRPRIPPGKWRHVNRDGILYTEEFRKVVRTMISTRQDCSLKSPLESGDI